MGTIGSTVFMESLGPEAKPFREYVDAVNNIKKLFHDNPQWASENKGSVRQYLRYFPDDHHLRELVKMI